MLRNSHNWKLKPTFMALSKSSEETRPGGNIIDVFLSATVTHIIFRCAKTLIAQSLKTLDGGGVGVQRGKLSKRSFGKHSYSPSRFIPCKTFNKQDRHIIKSPKVYMVYG